jgi:hypothetical protein
MARRTPQQRETAAPETAVVTYTNRMGDIYYLHEGRTKGSVAESGEQG